MAKKQIKDYRFYPAVTPPVANAYPNAVALLQENKSYIIAETTAYLQFQAGTPSVAPTAFPNAIALLSANKSFIQQEASAWIQSQITRNVAPFVGYVYDATKKAKCIRDIGFLIDAYVADLTGGGNAETIRISRMYYRGGVAQLLNPTQEAAVHNFIKLLISNYVFPKIAYSTQQSPIVATQVTSGTAGEGGASSRMNTLITIVTSLITGGLVTLPSIVYNYNSTFVGYTYDNNKCQRDVGYVIDSYMYDLIYGGNALTYYVASRYYIQGVIQINRPAVEIATHNFIKTLINSYILTGTYFASYQLVTQQTLDTAAEAAAVTKVASLATSVINVLTSGTSALPTIVVPNSLGGGQLVNAVGLITENKKFILEETIAYIQYNITNNIAPFVNFAGYNSTDLGTKCRRDISYVLEGYISDLKNGGNRQTVHNAAKYWENGVAQITIGNRQPETSAHTFIRDLILNFILPNNTYASKQTIEPQVINNALVSETVANTRLVELSNTILDLIPNGLSYLPAVVSNRGYIKVIGFYKLKEFLLVTNTSRNQILYNFADPAAAAEVTYSEFADADFPSFLQTADKVTTLTFYADTSTHMVTDNIQVFVEKPEQSVRFNPIATDAMERMKVGIPQSMLDADFEYGLQPTKWQAISLMRNYPSVYEIPGSDTLVTSVVTDASNGTAGIGSSLITVTTPSPHGLTVGVPFTIIALANTITGFSRAQGTFIVNTVPDNYSFTYYAKSKVGTSNGQVLATTYTQLRKGNFYTGASVGSPTFSVYSAGTSGTFTTSLNTASNVNFVGFTGTAPGVGSPLTVSGMPTGTQVTAVSGTGGTVATTTLSANANIGDSSITVTSTTSLDTNLVIDRGDGTAVEVTNIAGNVVTLSGALTSKILGTNASYTSLSQSATSGSGSSAVFTVSRNSASYSAVASSSGSGYIVGDTITILGTSLDGATTANDATLTVASATSLNSVDSLDITTLVAGNSYTNFTNLSTSGSLTGTGLTVDITVDNNGSIVSAFVNNPGANYVIGDTIKILNGTTRGIPITSTLATPGSGYASAVGVATSGGAGTGLTVDITVIGGAIQSILLHGGTGYQVNDTITVTGGNSDGTFIINSVTADGTIQVSAISAGGNILTLTAAGTPITASSVTFISGITFNTVTTSTIATSTSVSFAAIATIQVSFASNHGFVPGDAILTAISSSGSNHAYAGGPFYVEQTPTSSTIRFTARAPGSIDTSTQMIGVVYARPDSFYVHRPFDGGVQLGTGGPAHGAQAIRMSKKYIRYQSGKGVMYNTGALFAPSYDVLSISAVGTAVGSIITIATDDTDHGCQIGGQINLYGVTTSGYNGVYTVFNIIDERTLTVQAQLTLGSTSPVLGNPCQISVRNWHGATVRSGTFDEQNGMFWQYDGIRMAIGKRSSTFHLAGTITIAPGSNAVTGTQTRFTQQLAAGDRIVIRGMSHVVSVINSDTSLTVTPDYRGANQANNVKAMKTIDVIIPQDYWDNDPLNGSGQSGYSIDVTKMQMIGMQWTWYGAGFIDYMLRGADGNYVFAHRIRNSNVNTEAYMRSGNQPVRYEVINEGAKNALSSAMTNNQTTIPLVDAYWFPSNGTVMIDNELIDFSGKTATSLTGCTRSAQLNQFVAGSQRNFKAGPAATHAVGAGVILVSNTITPNISHWGSAFMIDGQFDNDRGYMFNYAATNVSISTTVQTAFLMRLAPSVSNAIIGDLGDRELINRAQLLLQGIEITSDSGTGGIVIQGVLNPSNYPVSPSDISWAGLSGAAAGGQPSFTQIAPGGSVNWNGGASTTTAASTTQAAMTSTLTGRAVLNASGSIATAGTNGLFSGKNYFYVLDTDWISYNSSGWAVGDSLSGTGIASGATITAIASTATLNGSTNYYLVTMSANATSTVSGAASITITRQFKTSSTSTIFFQQASWVSIGAKAGTSVADTLFGAGTSVSTATLVSFFGTSYYKVTFTQTSTATAITPGTTTVTFSFGVPAYAQPGETLFSFIAAPGGTGSLDLSNLKELTNTAIGGQGTFPNGPDVLAINVYKAAGSAINSNIIIRWGEAQA